MRLIFHILGAIVINAVALFVASSIIPAFWLNHTLQAIFGVALIFTILNFFIRPILKLLLAPLILLTLGLALLLVNGIILALVDKLTPDLSIQGIPALLLGTLVMSAVNIVFHLFTHKT